MISTASDKKRKVINSFGSKHFEKGEKGEKIV